MPAAAIARDARDADSRSAQDAKCRIHSRRPRMCCSTGGATMGIYVNTLAGIGVNVNALHVPRTEERTPGLSNQEL